MRMSTSAAESITHLDLDFAIQSKQLTAGFEPYVSLRKLEAKGVELHLIWQHPQFGPLLPGLFMPFIQAEGRTRQITGFMLREATRAAADFRRAGLEWSVSVNIPLEDLIDGTLPNLISMLLDEFNLTAETLIIDINESDLLTRSAQALPALTGLRALGCGVALDSAPGEAMIQDLRGLPFSEIKVSGAAIVQFIDRTRHSGEGRVAARVYNARSNGLPVTAVGVDSEPMLWSVQRVDFDSAQGPYICSPTDPIALVRWEKIWREAAENIRVRKVQHRRPLASARPVRAAPQPAPALDIAIPPEPPSAEIAREAPAPNFEAAAPTLASPQAPFEVEPAYEPIEEFGPGEETWPGEEPALDDAETIAEEPQDYNAESALEPAIDLAMVQEEATDEDALDQDDESHELGEPLQPFAAGGEPEMPEIAPPPVRARVSAVQTKTASGEDTMPLIARQLPGINRPIVMTVQNQGSDRFGFLKKMGRKR